MISPRLRKHMLGMFVTMWNWDRPSKERKVFWSEKVTTNETQIGPKDLRTLEQKGLLTFERSAMTDMFGVRFWDCKITDAGKEELEGDFARLCAEADAANEKLEPKPTESGEPGSESVRVRPRV